MKIRTIIPAGFFIAVLTAAPLSAHAGPIVRSGDMVSIEQGQVVEGDFYAAARSVSLSGEVKGDVYAAGGSITVNAPVAEDASFVGGTVQVHAPIADDLRVAGGEVTLGETVSGDVFVFGGTLRILSTAKVEGDILFFGGELVVEGPVDGSVFGFAEKSRVNAFVGGDIKLHSEFGLTLGDKAEVLGDINYKGEEDIVRAQNAVVAGNIQYDHVAKKEVSPESYIVPVLSLVFAALVAFLVTRRRLDAFVADTKLSYGINGLLGLAVFFGFPFVALILTVSILGLYIGIFLFAAYIALLLAAFILSSIVVGALVMGRVTKKSGLTIMGVVVGALLMYGCFFLPYVGPLLVFAIFLLTLGGIAKMIYRKF